ncbi:hypothetical protein L1049_014662 [Liquidambar formosana]|uniref:Uncharacterized protein n=1 Tax=Liquidambar formosana TaxID=63359 RepID=A0AAP0RXJ9_LIQFO
MQVDEVELIKRKNLQNDTDEPISMSVFWLVPQFFLIGLMEGLAEDGLDDFFSDQVTESMARYGPPINECALGIGKFLNVLCVFVFRSWFSQTIDSSHLDKYYTMLAALSLGNLCFYCIVSTCIFAQNEAQRVEVELIGISVVDATENVLSTKTDQSFSRSMIWPYRLRSLYRRSSRKVVVQAGPDAL